MIGFLNGPTQFTIQSKQYFPAGQGPSGSGSSSSSFLPSVQGFNVVRLVRVTVNPLTKSVTVQQLH